MDREGDFGRSLAGIRARAEDIKRRLDELILNFERNKFLLW